MQLVKDKKAAVLRASDSLEGVAKGDVVGKDLLSALSEFLVFHSPRHCK
jgi:hypothetical protein